MAPKLLSAIVVALCALSGASAAPRAHEITSSYSYSQYLKDFGKTGTPEGQALFESRLKEILAHNARPHVSYKRGINRFTDEVAPPMGRTASPGYKSKHQKPYTSGHVEKLPTSVDWRDEGVVSPVKNQGHCGSCWAFATTETVESHIALATDKLFSLSPQQLVACAPNDDHCGGYGGCLGSIPELAYDYLISAGGYAEEWSYPYISYDGSTNGTCSTPEIQAGIAGFVKLPENNASAVIEALATVGPLAINIDASAWHDYESGVYDGCSYESMDIDHVVVLVGYGTDEDTGLDYWLVRNSWSPAWGENGYIRLKRDPVDDTPCGVDTTPEDGTGCDGAATQYPCGQCGTVFDVSYPTGSWSN